MTHDATCDHDMPCEDVTRVLSWFLDDELDAEQSGAVERHLQHCDPCGQMLKAEGRLRLALRRVADAQAAPTRLHRRLDDLLTTEQNKRQNTWLRRLPAVAAAVILLALAWRGNYPGVDQQMLSDATKRHRNNLPMDVTAGDVGSLQRYLSAKLPFAVRLPDLNNDKAVPPQATPVLGARVTRFNNRAAAYVRYNTPHGRVSLFIVEDDPTSGNTAEQTPHHPMYRWGDQPVLLRRVHGFTTARWRSRGLGYTVITELPEGELPRVFRFEPRAYPTLK